VNPNPSLPHPGCLDEASGRDALLIGSARDLQAYDVATNADLFRRDVPDGVGALLVGSLGGHPPLALIGGNLSITGLNSAGREFFWTVSNEFVSALALCDADGDGESELLAGSHSHDIHVFKGEALVGEFKEADRISALCAVTKGAFGYALANGTVGVYVDGSRAWRIKSKSSAHAICAADLDGDGVPELLSGWGNGKVGKGRSRGWNLVTQSSVGGSDDSSTHSAPPRTCSWRCGTTRRAR